MSIFSFSPSNAQLNNTIFERETSIQDNDRQSLYFSLDNLNFLRNNEYFNEIVSGETLFGYQLLPSLVFYPSSHLRVEGGVFLWQDFGSNTFSSVSPVYSVTYEKDSTRLVFGTLEGNFAHRLIEPLYAFERGITHRLENGLQVQHHRGRWDLDIWIDWQQVLFKQEEISEEISGGAVVVYDLIQTPSFKFQVPLQATILHVGGQDLDLPLTNTINVASGLGALLTFADNAFWKEIHTEHYYTGSLITSSFDAIGNKDGLGYYGNLRIATKPLSLLFSVWLGKEYNSITGGELYRSFSTKNRRIEKHRDLLFVRLAKNLPLADNLHLVMRLEPYYDFNHRFLEFSIGFYLRYRPSFLLKEFK